MAEANEPTHSEKSAAERTREYFASIQDENGVDLTLILENLRLPPRERLVKLELARQQLLRLRAHATRIYPPAA